MPWTPEEFRQKHDHSLTDKQAQKAAEIGNAMLRSGTDDATAIATAIKHVKHQHRGGTR